ncbi:MAG: hypothetical protein VKL41_01425 [Snowella sp.]|nr:hypothetical protein [Snowella sp.]
MNTAQIYFNAIFADAIADLGKRFWMRSRYQNTMNSSVNSRKKDSDDGN